jgi:hypothetical protein
VEDPAHLTADFMRHSFGVASAPGRIVLKQDAVERLMPALDLVLRLPVAGRAVHVTHIAFVPSAWAKARTCAGATRCAEMRRGGVVIAMYEAKANWQLTTEDARIKLKRLYPIF